MPFKLENPTEQDERRLRIAITMIDQAAAIVIETLGPRDERMPSIAATALLAVPGRIIGLNPDQEERGQSVEHLQRYFFNACKPLK